MKQPFARLPKRDAGLWKDGKCRECRMKSLVFQGPEKATNTCCPFCAYRIMADNAAHFATRCALLIDDQAELFHLAREVARLSHHNGNLDEIIAMAQRLATPQLKKGETNALLFG